ncbi:sulfite oxidase [Planosporangium thailandense]|uniref:Sulfite oxidase n=2 Tax=Planosporangium thailandense TaxID=765197 RepID=A0ABX0Y970_9ACTN|nr:sulfite oxidase [Planosporangium thailandense]NJC74065.1 sulfite oxidase [Planosporangium thailandense]
MIVHSIDPYNAEPPRAALDGAALTPLDTFYSRNHGPVPRIDPRAWRLEVDGLVERTLVLSLADLRGRFDSHSVVATLVCAGNRRADLSRVRPLPGEEPWGPGAISTARWTGARLADVLAAAGVRPAAGHVAFTGPDVSPRADPPQPFGGSIPVAKAMAGEPLLAWEMNGEPLPVVHGAPVRVVVPGYIGARSVKWVRRISVQDRPSDNYFQASAYRLLPAEDHPAAAGLPLSVIALNAAILRPGDDQPLPAGPNPVSGYAVAGEDRRIARVDVSVDGGRHWQQADLGADTGPWAWRLWRATVDLPRGPAEIIARAWDTSAATQPERPEPLWNPQGYVNNSWPRVRVFGRPGPAGL